MRKRAPALSFETVIDELRASLLLEGKRPARAYLVLEKHGEQFYLDIHGEDIETRLEGLMSEVWVPLGFVAFFTDSSTPVTNLLRWYADLLNRDEKRYSGLCNMVSARLKEAARRLTMELLESHLLHRVQ